MTDQPERPIRDRDELLEPFRSACKPRARFRVGTEAEKFGVLVESGAPVPYRGPRGIEAILERLCERHGWAAEREVPAGPVIALRRGDASITLEPGGQLELSGAPLETIHLTSAEFSGHLAELGEPSAELGIAWLGIGFHPFARPEDFDWVPKLRYGVMRQYLPTRGAHALDMMQRTCTVQANFDYSSEEDAVLKCRVAGAASPIVTAMFANSPLVEGRPSKWLSQRARVWLDVDPDRTGIPEIVLEKGFGFARWVEWALDVPMFLVKRNGEVVHNTGQTFRSFLDDGFDGHRATMADWEQHLNTLFPEVRLKRTIELRGADSVPTSMLCALPALWKGILYHPGSLAAAESLLGHVGALDAGQRRALREDVATRALGATIGSRPVRDLAVELLDLAARGLGHLGCLSREGKDESIYLAELRSLVETGRCPADLLLERWRSGGVDGRSAVARLMELARY
ncbi:MAG: glutamate--cysteine ligase [Deltaproteobacteria bacterium]|nr:glutamate--cysteine ligase [Deltaproteobacteria bacterium]